MLFAGVDGGQTSTIAVIGDESGAVLGRGVGPPADLVGEARDSRRQADAIDAALDGARRNGSVASGARFDDIVCGLSGYDPGESLPQLRTAARSVRILHDSEIALAGALNGAPGIVVIAGTGSAALGSDLHGNRVRAGGWGFLFGDEGSAFWIARRAVTLAMHRADRGETPALSAALLAYVKLPSLPGVQQAFAHGELSRAQLAGFATRIFELARAGDVDAHLLRSDAARALADLVYRAHVRLEPAGARTVSYAGGVFTDEALRETWRSAVAERIRGAVVIEPHAEPALGALRLAQAKARA